MMAEIVLSLNCSYRKNLNEKDARVNPFEKAIKAIVQNLLQELIVRTSVIVKTNAKVPYLEEKKIVFEVYVNIGSWQLKKSLSDKFRFQTIFLLHQPSLAGLP